jgi:hypothetical protein
MVIIVACSAIYAAAILSPSVKNYLVPAKWAKNKVIFIWGPLFKPKAISAIAFPNPVPCHGPFAYRISHSLPSPCRSYIIHNLTCGSQIGVYEPQTTVQHVFFCP